MHKKSFKGLVFAAVTVSGMLALILFDQHRIQQTDGSGTKPTVTASMVPVAGEQATSETTAAPAEEKNPSPRGVQNAR